LGINAGCGRSGEAEHSSRLVPILSSRGGVTLAWCNCGWASDPRSEGLRGLTDAVFSASAAHDLDPDPRLRGDAAMAQSEAT
jgi:hypothetical protein